jgi:hypothetical protein
VPLPPDAPVIQPPFNTRKLMVPLSVSGGEHHAGADEAD